MLVPDHFRIGALPLYMHVMTLYQCRYVYVCMYVSVYVCVCAQRKEERNGCDAHHRIPVLLGPPQSRRRSPGTHMEYDCKRDERLQGSAEA